MLAIFESHPVQYRAPVYRALQRLVPDQFRVFYATDISVRGNRDKDFGTTVAWDEPLLEGYPHTILKQERGEPLKGFRSLHGHGLAGVFDAGQPQAVLLTGFLYEYDFGALLQARLRGIPVWIRQETQDEAGTRSVLKSVGRSAAYRLLYSQVTKGFYIGEMNRRHLVRHGLPPDRLVRTPYCTPDRFQNVTEPQFAEVREKFRQKLDIGADRIVVGFFGKLIPKKNPDLLMQMIPFLPDNIKKRIVLLFVGSGVMEMEMKTAAQDLNARWGIRSVFAGFVNQSAIRDYYAATDILVLPSRRAGETWGLVVNEGLQAGCGIVVSDAVGCGVEFKDWERVRVIPVGDAAALAGALTDLARFPHRFDWAREGMKRYSVEAAAEALAAEVRKL